MAMGFGVSHGYLAKGRGNGPAVAGRSPMESKDPAQSMENRLMAARSRVSLAVESVADNKYRDAALSTSPHYYAYETMAKLAGVMLDAKLLAENGNAGDMKLAITAFSAMANEGSNLAKATSFERWRVSSEAMKFAWEMLEKHGPGKDAFPDGETTHGFTD